MKLLILTFLCLLILPNSLDQRVRIIELDLDKATIPEGIVVNPKTDQIFISSVHLHKITKSDKDGKRSVDVIAPRQNGYTTGVGMEIKNNFLFALGSIDEKKKSLILQIDLKTNKVVNNYKLNDSKPNYFNDLAIDDNLNAYITDTEFHKIYKLNYKTGKIEVYLDGPQKNTQMESQSRLIKLNFLSTLMGLV